MSGIKTLKSLSDTKVEKQLLNIKDIRKSEKNKDKHAQWFEEKLQVGFKTPPLILHVYYFALYYHY